MLMPMVIQRTHFAILFIGHSSSADSRSLKKLYTVWLSLSNHRPGKTGGSSSGACKKTPPRTKRSPRRRWSWMSDLNRRPHDYESGALPTELIQRETSAFALYHAISVCQCRKRGFLHPGEITFCNHSCHTLGKKEDPGNPVGRRKFRRDGTMGKFSDFLFNLLDFSEAFPGLRGPFPKRTGLRNHSLEEAIQ